MPRVRLMTVDDVAARLQVSAAWVRDHATRRTPRLAHVKVGSLLRFRADDVEAFVDAQWRCDEAQAA